MKKTVLALLVVTSTLLFTGCGGSSSSSKDTTPKDFALIGAIDCRGISVDGGEVILRAKVNYDKNIKEDSFTFSYSVEDNVLKFETPIVSLTSDGSAYLLDGDMYIYPNTSDSSIIHVFDLSYLDGGYQRLYRGGCNQGNYIKLVDTNTSN